MHQSVALWRTKSRRSENNLGKSQDTRRDTRADPSDPEAEVGGQKLFYLERREEPSRPPAQPEPESACCSDDLNAHETCIEESVEDHRGRDPRGLTPVDPREKRAWDDVMRQCTEQPEDRVDGGDGEIQGR